MLDVLVVGAGPAGRAVAAECAERGLRTAVLDPAPTRPWRATYGAWTDELPADLPPGVVAARARGVVHALTRRTLDREYVVLDVPALRAYLDGRLAAAGVEVRRALVTEEQAALLCMHIRTGPGPGPAEGPLGGAAGRPGPAAGRKSSAPGRTGSAAEGDSWAAGRTGSADGRPDDPGGASGYAEQSEFSGPLPRARVVIDAGGAAQPLARPRRGVAAEQTAFGLTVPAEVAAPVLLAGEALFMDWRRAPGVGPDDWPTFLYALPLGDGRVLLEETSLARRPGLPIAVLADRLRARLAGHGVEPPADAEREVVRFAVDTPRHRAPGVLGFGAAAPLTHPATGYQVATALREAPRVAEALVRGWGGDPLRAARRALWPAAARTTHLLRRRSLESLLRMPPARIPEFFEGFFALPEHRRADFLDGRRRPLRTVFAMAGVYGTTSWPVRRDLIGSFLAAEVRSDYTDRSSGE